MDKNGDEQKAIDEAERVIERAVDRAKLTEIIRRDDPNDYADAVLFHYYVGKERFDEGIIAKEIADRYPELDKDRCIEIAAYSIERLKRGWHRKLIGQID